MAFVVYTGDVIGSSEQPARRWKQVGEAFSEASDALKEAFGGDALPLPIDVFRGDSWQFYSPAVSDATKIALYLKAWLLEQSDGGLHTRISIGAGEIEHLPQHRASEGDGEAYRLSGRQLEGMSRRETFLLAVPGRAAGDVAGVFTAASRLIDEVCSHWTAGQSRAIASALAGRTQDETAKRWRPRPISQQAVTQHLKRGGWDHLQPAIAGIDDAVHAIFVRKDAHG